MNITCFGEGPFVFRVNENGTGPQLLTQVCLERGWREYNVESGDVWNLWWKNSGFNIGHQRSLLSSQFINHIPKGATICRKDNLARYLKCMKKVYGSIYNFSPHGYNLPLEYTKLATEFSKVRRFKGSKDDQNSDDDLLEDECPIWIYKPVSQSQGKGIFLFRKLSELSYDANAIVQRYIEKPLLIGGYKFDLRLYVCVPSYHPVTVYIYKEGLVRFGTDKFNLNDLRNPFRHLTNYSLNKLGPGYAEMKDRVGSGCKWTFRQLRMYFQQSGISDWLLWQRISSLVALTVLSHVTQVPPSVNCFEFFGFDVLVDESLRPWLLEVNLSPALGNNCDADIAVKKPMLHDLFDLLGLPLFNTGLSLFTIWPDTTSAASCLCCDSDSDDQTISKAKNSTLSVITAAGKWRLKQKKNSKSRSSSLTRSCKGRINESTKADHAGFPKRNSAPQNKTLVKAVLYKPNFSDPLSRSREARDELRKSIDYRTWGNGKDWMNQAPVTEGGWVRICPMIKVDNKSNTKTLVGQISQFSKTAREIPKRYPTFGEKEWSAILQKSLSLTSDIWLPIK